MPDCRSISTVLPKRPAAIKGPAHHSYLALYSFCRSISTSRRPHITRLSYTNHPRHLTTSSHTKSSSQFRRSDFTGQPFTGSYEPGEKTSGPLGDASILGAPRLTPRVLKQHLDNFVVGQERAKKVLSVAVYNHYQRVQEMLRREEEEHEILQQQLRREMAESHPLEDEFPGHQQTIPLHSPSPSSSGGLGAPPIIDPSPLTLDKSNILLLGPSGVGKTLMAKTLARVLAVPFSMSDCTPFTQAGYIGEDAEICVQRLLAAANYDVAAAERGIICLDEIDKISTTKVANGKDVGGEGVQQALLKIIEGTTLQIQAKSEKSARGGSGSGSGSGGGGGGGASFNSAYPTNSPLSGSSPPPNASSSTGPSTGGGGGGGGSGKPETYSIRTDNILFIFAGAFIGLDKMIQKRIEKGSIGFNSPIKSSASSSSSSSPSSNKKSSKTSSSSSQHLPFFSPHSPNSPPPGAYNPLDLCEPTDLQTYGLIPELTGRIPITTALAPLTLSDLVRVLTEPRNCLLKQYEMLFSLSGVELRFTRAALRAVGEATEPMGTGARGLRKVMEGVLEEGMFEAPGSSIKHILITEAVARRRAPPIYLARGQQGKFHALIAAEEEEWDRRSSQDGAEEGGDKGKGEAGEDGEGKEGGGGEGGRTDQGAASFEEYRERSRSAGVM
ncbi:MAG: ATP-binding protein [Ramalina farinacea]|uniref:ATP-binding protein n=1 Tax=Ramalina farinacea TaxID=258253 RepID=A0AA43TYK6_9LECA|nr:ATP-binding protein [Ramalina farinacea]